MRQSHTSVLERNVEWTGAFTIEPYEVAWASEAIYFVHVLDAEGVAAPITANIQLSPDGIHWCDEGSALTILHEPGLTFCRLSHFGGWLRAVGTVPDGGKLRVIVYLVLKE